MFEKNYKIEDFIGTFDNFVRPETCDDLIDFFEKEKKMQNTWSRKNSENVSGNFKSDEQFYVTRDHLEGSGKKSFEEVLTSLREALEIYAKQTDILRYMEVEELHLCVSKIQKTLPSQGYHVWHVEKSYTSACSRVLVYTIYFNDIIAGGETEFLFQKKRVPAKKGRICIFPAHFPYVHRGNPPLDEAKYIMTSWYHANPGPVYL
jgi:hypothetical protein